MHSYAKHISVTNIVVDKYQITHQEHTILTRNNLQFNVRLYIQTISFAYVRVNR